MARRSRASELERMVQMIGELRREREELTARLSEIDQLFQGLGFGDEAGGSSAGNGRRRGRPRGSRNRAPSATGEEGGRRGGGRRRRGRFERSGEDSVLAFVTERGNPNAAEVNEHWRGEGRGGKADNALSKLVRDGRLKRVEAKGERGGRYAVA